MRCFLLPLSVLLLWGAVGQAQQSGSPTSRPDSVSPVQTKDGRSREKTLTALRRTIKADFSKVPLASVLKTIAQRGEVDLIYDRQLVEDRPAVTLNAESISVSDAFNRVLAGTTLRIIIRPSGQLALVDTTNTPRQAPKGIINGQIIDSATGQPLSGVSVLLQGTDQGVLTGENGRYMLRDVTDGSHVLMVRLFGYASQHRTVSVVEGRSIMLSFQLRRIPNTLSEVVTTATGVQRRIETGTDIAKVNVDSLVRMTPIRNVTDILAARIPGLQVTRSSGAVGSPSRIRIRGLNSAGVSNDPLIIVDGFPVNGAVSTNDVVDRLGSGVPVPSRLDDIDPETIETIDVLRGPSAAALYGSDAANGIIIITTKRGKPGPTRVSTSITHDWSGIPGAFPPVYKGWGRTTFWREQLVACDVNAVASGGCAQDSVSVMNPINDPFLTTIARGSRTNASVAVSGGVQQIRYSLTLSHNDEIGPLKLANAEAARIRLVGYSVPRNIRRPNTGKTTNLSGSFTAMPSPTTTADVSINFVQLQNQKNLIESNTGGDPRDTLVFGTNSPYTIRPIESINNVTRGFGGLNTSWRPMTWLNTTGKFGADYTSRGDYGSNKERSCYQATGCQSDPNHGKAMSHDIQTVYNVDLGANTQLPIHRFLSSRTQVGVQYTARKTDGTTLSAAQLAPGSEDIATATIKNIRQLQSEEVKVGAFLSQTFAMADRLYLNASIRRDASSAFGRDVQAPSYPKFDMSWLVFDGPSRLSLGGLVNSFRARFGFGHAGSPPSNVDAPTTYTTIPIYVNGAVGTGIRLRGVGNPGLRAERTVEFETGGEIDLLDRRSTVSVTFYRKQTRDALIDRDLGMSVGSGLLTRKENVGKVRNQGFNLSLDGRLIERPGLIWSGTITAASNDNRVITLGTGVTPFGTAEDRIVEGYPLFSRWRRPVLGYSDRNGDGVLGTNEIVLGDSAIYAGVAQPRYTMSYSSTLTIRRFTMNANLGYDGGKTQLQNQYDGWGGQDIRSPITEQAYSAIARVVGNWQTISTLRLNSASISYEAPEHIARYLRARSMQLSFHGANLGLWTQYRGKDPDVNGSPVGDKLNDPGIAWGVVPQTRNWSVVARLGF